MIEERDEYVEKRMLLGIIIMLGVCFFGVLHFFYIKASSDYAIIDGIVTDYYVPPKSPKGRIIKYQFEGEVFQGPCVIGFCRNLRIGDTVKVKVYLSDHTIFDVIPK